MGSGRNERAWGLTANAPLERYAAPRRQGRGAPTTASPLRQALSRRPLALLVAHRLVEHKLVLVFDCWGCGPSCTACLLLLRHASFEPARNAAGEALVARYRLRMTFKLND